MLARLLASYSLIKNCLRLFYVSATALAFYVHQHPKLKSELAFYGKLSGSVRLVNNWWQWTVLKDRFWHFYLVSALWNGFLLIATYRWFQAEPLSSGIEPVRLCSSTEDEDAFKTAIAPFLCLLIFETHVLRRLVECRLTLNTSKAIMHVAHYLLGVSFYVVTPLTFYVELPDCIPQYRGIVLSTVMIASLW